MRCYFKEMEQLLEIDDGMKQLWFYVTKDQEKLILNCFQKTGID